MIRISQSTILIVLMFIVTNCSPISTINNDDHLHRLNNFPIVQTHAYAVIDAYKKGNYSTAHNEFTTVMGLLNIPGLTTETEKIEYLDQYFPTNEWGLTYAVIKEELDWHNPVGNSQIASSHIKPNMLSSDGNKYQEDNTHNQSVLDRDAAYNNIPANNYVSDSNKADMQSHFSIGNYFKGDLHRFIQKEIKKTAVSMGELKDFKLPDDFVEEIEFYIRRFQKEPHYRDFFERALRRSRKYIPVLSHYFTEKGFPEEIMFLAFIESGFNPAAYSRAKAVGMFQFIKSTGKAYGLKINRYYDERYSPIKSAIACREYLHDLLLELGSFTLALSSYNSGAGKTRTALRQLDNFKDRSFWALRIKTKVLKRETRRYVPQIFAAIVMGKPGNVEKFGFKEISFPEKSKYRVVIVPKQIKLKLLANAAGISVKEILALNPDLGNNAIKTPPRVLDYPLFVPKGTEREITKTVKKINSQQQKTYSRSSQKRKEQNKTSARSLAADGEKRYHSVSRGEALTTIARRYGVTVNQLKRWNSLENDRIYAGQKLTVYLSKSPGTSPVSQGKITHRVRPGESLSVISDKYRVKIKNIKEWNGLYNNTIRAGDKLIIYLPQQEIYRTTATSANSSSSPGSGSPSQSRTLDRVDNNRSVAYQYYDRDYYGAIIDEQTIYAGEYFMYKVKSGNTLGEIAELFDISINKIKKWNGIRSSRIKVSQRLKIVASKSIKFYKYQVQAGDTIGDIANRFNASVRSVKLSNGLNGNTIRAGEILSVFSI